MSVLAGGGTPETADGTHILRTKNCGIAEVSLLSYAKNPLHALQMLEPQLKYGVTWPFEKTNGEDPQRKDFLFPFVTFTGVVGSAYYTKISGKQVDNYGQKFADYIIENGLGTVTTLPGRLNWTGKDIQLWLWAPNYPALFAHLDEVRNAKQEGR